MLRSIPILTAWTQLFAHSGEAADISVLVSGAFTGVDQQVLPQFERTTGNKLVSGYDESMGNAPDSIPLRLNRGEAADVVILAANSLEVLISNGHVRAGSGVDLVRSTIGMAVRSGAMKPDIGSVEALKQKMLAAKFIAYS